MHEHAAHPRDPHTQLPRDIDKGTYLKQLLQDKKTLHHMLAYSYVGFHQIENLLNAGKFKYYHIQKKLHLQTVIKA